MRLLAPGEIAAGGTGYGQRLMIAGGKPAAVLIVNPASGALSPEEREEATTALHEHFRLEVIVTTERDAAIGLARDAAGAGPRVVIAFGGDGHVNEVVNGLAGSGVGLGIIPGGTMNVFARALSIPHERAAAIEALAARVRTKPRSVPLGRMDDRYFTFSAGCGFDAEVADRVESHLPSKRRFGEPFFYWSAFRVLTGSYRHRDPSLIAEGPFGRVPVAMAIASNCGPYAYLAGRAVRIAPEVRLNGGLDLFALRSMRLEFLPLYAWRAAVSGDLVHHRDAFYERGLEGFTITAAEPFARHTDGEPLAPATSARFAVVRDAITIFA